eukprot:6170554-Alexandrium_andersonii.AAC.1
MRPNTLLRSPVLGFGPPHGAPWPDPAPRDEPSIGKALRQSGVVRGAPWPNRLSLASKGLAPPPKVPPRLGTLVAPWAHVTLITSHVAHDPLGPHAEHHDPSHERG